VRRLLIPGILLAVVASAITSVGVLMASGPSDPPKGSTADKALTPNEVTKLPDGQLATSLKLPYDYGRFRIADPAGQYHYCVDESGRKRADQLTKTYSRDAVSGAQYAPAPQIADGRVQTVTNVVDLQTNSLYALPSYMPAGWKLANAETFEVTYDDGSHEDTSFYAHYDQPGYFYIDVRRFVIPAGCQFEVQDIGRVPDSQHAITLTTLQGEPAVIQHQAPGQKIQATLQVMFIEGNVVTLVESVAIDLDDLTRVAQSLMKGGS
jgi:hypothetical protein